MISPRGLPYYTIRILALFGLFFVIDQARQLLVPQHVTDRALSYLNPAFPTAPGATTVPPPHDLDGLLDHEPTHASTNSTNGSVDEGGQAGVTKAIVVASIKREDTKWVKENFPDWDVNVYVANDKKAEFTVLNQGGHEVAVFLTYIIQHYYSLPEYIVFIHARRYQWHNDDPLYDAVPTIQNLRLQHVKKVGYQSLRCAWVPGCDVPRKPLRPDVRGSSAPSKMQKQLAFLFPGEPIPIITRAPCCGTFAVHSSRILARPAWYWEKLRQRIWSGYLSDYLSGRLFEYTWHMIMGQPAEGCMYAKDCYCQVYGLCNLDCPHKSYCQGRWRLPPWGRKVPVELGWPNVTGVGGYPKGDWFMKFQPYKSGRDPRADPHGMLQKGAIRWDFRIKPQNNKGIPKNMQLPPALAAVEEDQDAAAPPSLPPPPPPAVAPPEQGGGATQDGEEGVPPPEYGGVRPDDVPDSDDAGEEGQAPTVDEDTNTPA